MFEVLFVLTFFGVMYVDIIELLEKCTHPHTDTGHEANLEYQESFTGHEANLEYQESFGR
jgi:hypothetical protein